MTVNELAKLLDEQIPATLSEPWDNDGRMVIPDGNAEVCKVLCALDCTSYAISKAVELGCNVIVTHHPLIFHPLKSLKDSDSVGHRVLTCIRHGIAVLSYHTRLDSMEGGVNDCLAETLGLTDTQAFLPFARVGTVPEMPFCEFVCLVTERLHEQPLLTVHANESVKRVAVLSGSGKGELRAVLSSGADTFVSGEIPHDELIDGKELGLNIISTSHYATERMIAKVLAKRIGDMGIQVVCYLFDKENEYGV